MDGVEAGLGEGVGEVGRFDEGLDGGGEVAVGVGFAGEPAAERRKKTLKVEIMAEAHEAIWGFLTSPKWPK